MKCGEKESTLGAHAPQEGGFANKTMQAVNTTNQTHNPLSLCATTRRFNWVLRAYHPNASVTTEAGIYHDQNDFICEDEDGPASTTKVCEIVGLAYSGPSSRLLYMAVSAQIPFRTATMLLMLGFSLS